MDEITHRGRRLRSQNFCEASFGFRRWSAVLEEGQTLDDCREETFWGHIAAKVMGHDPSNPKGRGDIIEVRNFDNTLYAEFLVVAVANGSLRTRLMRYDAHLALPDMSAPSGPLAAKWNVGRRMFDVVRQSDKSVISTGHQTREDALKWIAETVKQVA